MLAEYGRIRERFENLGGYTIEAQARAVLTGLGFKESDLQRCTDEFSGGWLIISSPLSVRRDGVFARLR